MSDNRPRIEVITEGIPLIDLIIIYDHIINGMPYAKIGEKFSWSHEYIRIRFNRAIKKIREQVKDEPIHRSNW